MAEQLNYYDLPGTNKVCPIMSIAQIRFNGNVIECVGEKCKWYQRCDALLLFREDPFPRP